MKHSKLVVLTVIALMFLGMGCNTTSVSFKAPPGQVKKATGSKSAKPYAPGQQKKNKNK